MNHSFDIIPPEEVGTLPRLFLERVRRSPAACAYRRFGGDGACCEGFTWEEMRCLAGRWQAALRRERFEPGDRVAVMLRNSVEWVAFDLAALGLGLVSVPLFVNDRAENFAHIIEATQARLLLIEGVEHWLRIKSVQERLDSLCRIVSLTEACQVDCDPRLIELDRWLLAAEGEYTAIPATPDDLATIVYTSGTTGHPKGVMLTHANILMNARAGASTVPIGTDDQFLSFLPLSHTLERTVGYYLPIMTGTCVAHVRSLETLGDDLKVVRPTVIIAVPRIFERVYHRLLARLAAGHRWKRQLFDLAVTAGWHRVLHRQGRANWSPLLLAQPLLDWLVGRPLRRGLGGRLRAAISGGAPLEPGIAKAFIALGVTILQGYGLTETSPVVSVNTEADNVPETVGVPLPGVEVGLGEGSELLVRGPNLMAGYWRDPEATAAVIDAQGWLHTGDQARLDAGGRIVITGRLKEIIVMANGEKVPPADMELAIAGDTLFEQVMVVGEGRPYLAALVVLNAEVWQRQAAALGIDPRDPGVLEDPRVEAALLERTAKRLHAFPGYAKVRRVHAGLVPWGIDDGLLTATLKLRRAQIVDRFAAEIERLYTGH